MASDDPHFETKAADVIGLYLAPPQHAAVFCVDEKTAIQALDRKDRRLPLSPWHALSVRGAQSANWQSDGPDGFAATLAQSSCGPWKK